MTLKREDIKKLVIQQMLQESIQEESSIGRWLRSKVAAGAQAGGEKLTKFGQEIAPKPEEDPEFLRDLSKIADFIQMFRNNKTVTDSDFYKKFVMGMQEQVNEQYQSQFLKQILSKKPTVADVEGFVKSISSSPALHKNLKSLELKKVEVPSSPTTQQPASQTGDKKVVTTEKPPETVAKATSSPVTEPKSDTEKAPPPSEVELKGTSVNTKGANIQVKPDKSGRRRATKQAQDAAEETAKKIADMLVKQQEGTLSAKEQNELIQLLIKNPSLKPQPQLQEAIVEEIFNLLTGKTK
jgi:hypothetical protein